MMACLKEGLLRAEQTAEAGDGFGLALAIGDLLRDHDVHEEGEGGSLKISGFQCPTKQSWHCISHPKPAFARLALCVLAGSGFGWMGRGDTAKPKHLPNSQAVALVPKINRNRLSTTQRAYDRALMLRQTNNIVRPSGIVGAGELLDNADQCLLSIHLLPSRANEAYRKAQRVFSFRRHDAEQPSLLISAGGFGVFAARVAYEIATDTKWLSIRSASSSRNPRRIFSGRHLGGQP